MPSHQRSVLRGVHLCAWLFATVTIVAGCAPADRDGGENIATGVAAPTVTAALVDGTSGLTAEYFDNMDFTNLKVTRIDPMVDFNFGTGSPAAGIGPDTFSVRWTGKVTAVFTETYTFFTLTDDGVRLSVNGQQLVNDFVNQSATERSGTIALVAGQSYDIRMEYFENTGNAQARLSWSSPRTPKQVIPQAQLTPAVAPPPPSFPIKINFQLAGVPIPAGYIPDTGALFGARNGLSYGWNRDHTDVTRDRNINPDQRLDTFCHFHAGGVWQIDLPNGTYNVTASVGDAQVASTHTLNVEGINYWNAVSLAANRFLLMTRSVTVSDGKLTVDQGGAAEKLTRIDYLEIATGGAAPDGGADTGSGGGGGQSDAGPAGTGGMEVTDAGGSGGAPGGDDAPVADTGTDAAPGGGNIWTGTWAAAPQSCGGNAGQTVRSIVRTSIGGNPARVRISNAFGNGPLHISNVHLAQRTSGSSIDPATDKALTFAGQTDVTVPARMFALSDGADFVVKPISDVAISFFVVSSSGGTCQPNAFQTNFVVGGDMVSSPTLIGAPGNTSYLYALGLDVQNPAAEGAVVALGASITTGFRTANDTNKRWPNLLAIRVVNANRVIGVLNEGISGDITSGALGRFERDVLSQTNVKWVIFSDNPINDLGGRSTAANDISQIKTMISSAHARGVKFLCSTLTPFSPAEPGRTTVINFVKSADSGCDGIIDQDRATHNPAAPTTWAPQFNSGDSLHPNAAGMQAIADIVDLAVFK